MPWDWHFANREIGPGISRKLLQDVRAGTLRSLDGEWFNAVVKIAEVRSTQSIALSVLMKVNQMMLILGGGFGSGHLPNLIFHVKDVACLYSSSASLLDTLGETSSAQ